MTEEAKAIGSRIKDAMLQQGLSQRELAKRAGATEGSVSRYISGDRTPDARTIVKLADALGVTTDYILGLMQDAQTEYNTVRRSIQYNAERWTFEQKRELLYILFLEEERDRCAKD